MIIYHPVVGAMRVDGTLYYVLKDHLGSASVVTDASGNVVGEQRYYPFGETRWTSGTMLTDKLFTGQREMADLDIYHYGARFYEPTLGRFLSPDTIIPSYANPQSLNRFSYVTNNPLRYTDPTGHRQCEEYAGTCLSEKQTSQKYEADRRERRNRRENNDGGSKGPGLNSPTPAVNQDPPTHQECANSGFICGGDNFMGYVYDPSSGITATWYGSMDDVKYNSFTSSNNETLNVNLSGFMDTVDQRDNAIHEAYRAGGTALVSVAAMGIEAFAPGPGWVAFAVTTGAAVVSTGILIDSGVDIYHSEIDASTYWNALPGG